MAEAVLIVDVNGVIIYANSLMRKLTGYERHELIGSTLTIFWPPGTRVPESCKEIPEDFDEFEVEFMRKKERLRDYQEAHWSVPARTRP